MEERLFHVKDRYWCLFYKLVFVLKSSRIKGLSEAEEHEYEPFAADSGVLFLTITCVSSRQPKRAQEDPHEQDVHS